jgi:hypothetical protein
MKKYLLVMVLCIICSPNIYAYDTNFSLHGSRASFLMMDSKWMTLNYLHPNANKNGMRAAAKANGDTHIYLYSRNAGDNGGGFNLGQISPQADWETQLDVLNASGLKPVMWLTPDDSRAITVQSLDEQKAHFNEVVRRFDNKVTGYVACLECDEYWSPAMVNALVIHLKSITDKPVGVHLTSGIGGHKGKNEYYANADYVFLQTGWNKTPAEITAMVKQAMAVTGKPVVASEYATESRTAAARALGDAACRAGAIGTGNGRSVTLCGYEAPPPPKKKYDNYYYAVGALVIVAIATYVNYDYDATGIELRFDATDNYSRFGVKKTFQLTEQSSFSLEVENYEQDYNDDNRLLVSYQFSW